MNKERLFVSPKWEIMEEIAKNSQSPTRLAKKMRTSIPNILHHLKLLEAYGIVNTKTIRSKNSGKPPTIYGLANPLSLIILIDGLGSKKKIMTPKIKERFIIRTIIEFDEKIGQALIKVNLEHSELITENTAISIFNIKDNKADLLVITPEIELFRVNKNKLKTKIEEKEYVFTIWSHTQEEYIAGINKNEEYFIKFLKTKIIHDPKRILLKVKNEIIK